MRDSAGEEAAARLDRQPSAERPTHWAKAVSHKIASLRQIANSDSSIKVESLWEAVEVNHGRLSLGDPWQWERKAGFDKIN